METKFWDLRGATSISNNYLGDVELEINGLFCLKETIIFKPLYKLNYYTPPFLEIWFIIHNHSGFFLSLLSFCLSPASLNIFLTLFTPCLFLSSPSPPPSQPSCVTVKVNALSSSVSLCLHHFTSLAPLHIPCSHSLSHLRSVQPHGSLSCHPHL